MNGSGSRPRLWLHGLLLLATFYTTTLCGALAEVSAADLESARAPLLNPRLLLLGLPYSLCLLAILGVHELGHYVACRRYGVDASLPYFLPSLPFPIGTFGAFIRIRAPIPDRKALFDIGVAGPIAGFLVAIPVLLYGVMTTRPVPIPDADAIPMDLPLLMSWLFSWLAPDVTEGHAVMISGPLMAGWVGCLATAINLIPIGQLDGGHLCYALSSRFHRAASWISLVGFVALGLLAYSGWLFLATLLIVFGPTHPPVQDSSIRLSTGRILVAAAAFIILIICFIPRPFSFDQLQTSSP